MGVREETRVGVVLAGTVRPAGWKTPGMRRRVLRGQGHGGASRAWRGFVPQALPFLHPGRSAVVRAGGVEVGWVGELHPEVAERFELGGWPVAAFELDLASASPDPEPRFQPFVNVPAVVRDLAVLVEEWVPVGDMLSLVEGMRQSRCSSRRGFSTSTRVARSQRARRASPSASPFRAKQTLTDEEVNAEMRSISGRLASEFGAQRQGLA